MKIIIVQNLGPAAWIKLTNGTILVSETFWNDKKNYRIFYEKKPVKKNFFNGSVRRSIFFDL